MIAATLAALVLVLALAPRQAGAALGWLFLAALAAMVTSLLRNGGK